MRIDNVSFPYPVLGISDDIKPTLEETNCESPIINVDKEGNNIVISIQISLQNDDIIDYIEKDDAEFSLEVSCPATLYRHCEKFNTLQHTFPIPQAKLNVELDFETFVIAKKQILNYTNRGLNPDYNGHTINLNKGDLLVAFRPSRRPLDIDLRNIKNPKSFISVDKNPDSKTKHVFYNLYNQKIQILLPEQLFEKYQRVKDEKIIFKASLYFDAIVYALSHFSEFKSENYLWVRTIKSRMQDKDVMNAFEDDLNDLFDGDIKEDITDDIYKLAQIMFELPYDNLMNKIIADRERDNEPQLFHS